MTVSHCFWFQSVDPDDDLRDDPAVAGLPGNDLQHSNMSSDNIDFFGPEMADLQQLLVSMATGKGIEILSAYYPLVTTVTGT